MWILAKTPSFFLTMVWIVVLVAAQVRSQVWIWGDAFPAKVDLFTWFPGERGLFRVFFWGEKVDLYASFFKESGLFHASTIFRGYVPRENLDWKLCIYRHYDLIIFHSKLWQTKHVQNCGPFWTLWTKIVDHFGHFGTMGGGDAFALLAPPWLRD